MIRVELALKEIVRDFDGRFKVSAGYGDPVRITCTPPFSVNGVLYTQALSVRSATSDSVEAAFSEIYISYDSVFSIEKHATYEMTEDGIKELQGDVQAHLDLIMARESRDWEK